MKQGHLLLLSIISDGIFHSGEELARQLNISRAAIWKSIKQLRSLGVPIEAVRGKGYRLSRQIELLSRDKINNKMSARGRRLCKKLEILFNTESTNSYLNDQLNIEPVHGHIVLAEYQSKGKGRRGNKWFSPLGSGFYMSIGWQFDLFTESTSLLSLYIGIAIVRALKTIGLGNVELKWPNDIVINHKKIGGVLLDMRGEANGPVTTIIGVGVNYDYPESIADKIEQDITDICSNIQKKVSRNDVAAILLSNILEILDHVSNEDTEGLMQEWCEYDCLKGKPAKLYFQDSVVEGIVEGVDDLGSLIMNINGTLQRFTSGELSLRLKT
ncbi:MAG: biotin--[acetyl-CoA-carboxylase] ligase [Proteobacteria bacterium]|nr:biotin--[acetyl-CoA-carboxylase] ligase [Pseudomonadota bacterium]